LRVLDRSCLLAPLRTELGWDPLAKMKRQHAPALAIGIGAVAGLRPMMAPRSDRLGPKAGMDLARAFAICQDGFGQRLKRIAEFAMSELTADKLPFTRSRLNAAPLASRVASGAICRAAIHGTLKQSLAQGAVLGRLGALAGLSLDTTFVRDSIARCLTLRLRFS
jgi:uncharacterized membrane protein